MKTMILGTLALLLLGGVEHKQDITGTWQGTLQAGRDLRTVVKISKADNPRPTIRRPASSRPFRNSLG